MRSFGFLSACMAATLVAAAVVARCTPGPVPVESAPAETTAIRTTDTPIPAPPVTGVPTPLPSATHHPPATFPPALVPTETATPAEICSPLGDYAFSDLPQIVSSPFEMPRPGKDDGHHGTDFAHYRFGDRTTIAGVPVQALFDGVVAAAVADSWPYGNFVIIETIPERVPISVRDRFEIGDSSVYHLYAHLAEPPVLEIGQPVRCGEQIGAVGNTGASGNFHLHLEVRLGMPDVRFESMAYYQTTTTEAERANYETWRFSGAFSMLDPMLVLCAGAGCAPSE